MKFLSFFAVCAAVICAATTASAAINTTSGKYAALVINSDTGEVMYARNADVKRFPASLTKMMTLYMVFDALEKGELDINERMKVSKFAASQPQTNISLIQGETIPVRDAIRALVVRSANDVATVFAERLGGSEAAFAVKTTAKARSLGMKNTVFRNPHGLPNVNQYTTARDMARLGIALRRDFPQHYHYFSTKSFSWKGRTFNTHNHVLSRYNGVDGIKTGYINMSGFNIVTSVKREGHNLVAVVMGGQTWRDRDDHVVSILDKSYKTLAERGDEPRMIAEAPMPQSKPLLVQTEGEKVKMVRIETVDLPPPVPTTVAAAPVAAAHASVAPAKPEVEVKAAPVAVAVAPRMMPASYRTAEPGTLEYQLANLSPMNAAHGKWGIQVGAFSDANSAMLAASDAIKVAHPTLKNSKIMVTNQVPGAKTVHRARLSNLSEHEAKTACRQIMERNGQCFVFRADLQSEL